MDNYTFNELVDYYTRRHKTEEGIDGWTYLFGDQYRVKVGHTINPPPLRIAQCFYKGKIPKVKMHAFKTAKFGVNHSHLENRIKHEMRDYVDWTCRETKFFGKAPMSHGATEVFLVSFDQATILAYRVLNQCRTDITETQLELPFEEGAK